MPDTDGAPVVSEPARASLLGIAVLLGLAIRLSYGWHAPLWLDETFSAVIATQPDFAHLVGWCLTELSGPAFYMPLWLWAKVAGDSDFALRLPCLAWSIAAPTLIWLRGHPDRDVRLFWTVIVLLWLPAAFVAAEARPYPQLFLLATAQAISFRRLIDRPNRRAALLWSSATAFAVLTHYSALVIGGVQGILYLCRHRRAAIATVWPAVAPGILVALWLAAQWAFLTTYVGKHDAAFATLPLSAILDLPAMLFGVPVVGCTIILVCGLTLALTRPQWIRIDADGIVILSGVIALVVIFGLGFVRPNFAPRYLTSTMPAILFTVACWARWQFARDWKPVAIVLAMFAMAAGALVRTALTEPDADPRHANQIETASTWLRDSRPSRLILFWDGPIAAASRADRIGEVGSFFLKRAGDSVPVTVVRARMSEDPKARVFAAMRSNRGAAMLWITNPDPSSARAPRLAGTALANQCQDFGAGVIVVLACRPARGGAR